AVAVLLRLVANGDFHRLGRAALPCALHARHDDVVAQGSRILSDARLRVLLHYLPSLTERRKKRRRARLRVHHRRKLAHLLHYRIHSFDLHAHNTPSPGGRATFTFPMNWNGSLSSCFAFLRYGRKSSAELGFVFFARIAFATSEHRIAIGTWCMLSSVNGCVAAYRRQKANSRAEVSRRTSAMG